MIKTLNTISTLEINQDVISVFASGNSINNIKQKDLLKIFKESYCIWFNFAPVKYNKFIDCLFWMDWKVSVWLDRFYKKRKIPLLWTRDMAFYEHRKLSLKGKVFAWFDDESEYLEKTNLSLVKCLLELTKHFPDKKILLFGLDLKGEKFYTKYLKKGDDNWKHTEDQKIDLSDCEKDLKLVKNPNIINCNLDSPCNQFKKDDWRLYLKYSNRIRLKGPSGLGDALYSYPIVKYYIDAGLQVEILTKYRDVYKDLNCKFKPSFYFHYDIDFSYVCRKFHKKTNQFEDMVKLAGIQENIKMVKKYRDKIHFNTDKKICIVQRPYWPMNETEKRFDLVPNYLKIQKIINNHPEYYYVMVGNKNSMNISFDNIDMIYEDTSIFDLFSLINSSDMVLTQIGWTIAMAEILNKKVFVCFSQLGFSSENWFFNTITPKKVIIKDTSSYFVDDMNSEEIEERYNKLICLK